MKKEFRKLSDDEKKITKKVLGSREDELSHLKLMIKYNNFMLPIIKDKERSLDFI